MQLKSSAMSEINFKSNRPISPSAESAEDEVVTRDRAEEL